MEITLKLVILVKLDFLDNQEYFAEVFGDNPIIISPNVITSQDFTSTARILYSFGDKYKLYVFIHICRKYYFGNDSIDNSLSVQDVC